MDFNAWEADLSAGTATHSSGFVLKIEGHPKNPSSVDPGKFPPELSFVDQARLLRCGMDFLAKASDSGPVDIGSWKSSSKADDARTAAIKAREEEARRFAERDDKPQRAVLSLKKRD